MKWTLTILTIVLILTLSACVKKEDINNSIEKKLLEEVRKENQGEIEPSKLKELLKHSKVVRDISVEIADDINITGRDKELIIAGALLHDIKKHTGDKHNKIGAEYVENNINNFFECNNKGEKELIMLMVRFHKGEKYREKNYDERQIQMIEIVRASDKIAKLYKSKTINVESDIENKISKLINEDVKESAFKILEKHLSKNKDIINNK